MLTTHHMEEAEYLADRVGVMAHGKLLTLGTSDFIKKTFGIGYNFRVSNKVNGNIFNIYINFYIYNMKIIIEFRIWGTLGLELGTNIMDR